MPDVKSKGILLLAPTGKARVRMEEQTRLRGAGRTLAQFLNGLQRYDGETGAYFPKPKAPRCGDYRTVIVDECSMLTEEQLAALIDSLTNVERLVLVGDPRQLPPIGAGRPFVDIVKLLEPANVGSLFPRCGASYAELTIPRRQQGESRPDVLLGALFSGRPIDPGADAVLDGSSEDPDEYLRLVQWSQPQELQEKIVGELVRALQLEGADDELGFEESLGGARYQDWQSAFFWSKYGDNPGAASKAESWQALSPVRAGLTGVDALNRMIQGRFRAKVRELAETEGAGGARYRARSATKRCCMATRSSTSLTSAGATCGQRLRVRRTSPTATSASWSASSRHRSSRGCLGSWRWSLRDSSATSTDSTLGSSETKAATRSSLPTA
jgi:hypothetical protein